MPRNRNILPSLRRFAKEHGIDTNSPEYRLAEAQARTIDGLTPDGKARLLPNHAPQFNRSLDRLRELAEKPAAPPDSETPPESGEPFDVERAIDAILAEQQ